jgi:predicted NAD-dependent protein-ADP-ribosyltransferase YbiA (DUF1768 family)
MVKSILNPNINYNESKVIDIEDVDYSTVIYEYKLYNIQIEIALGKIKYNYMKYDIVFYYIYLIVNDQPRSKIGVFEINNNKVLNNINDDEVLDLSSGNILIFISKSLLEKYLLGSQSVLQNSNSESINDIQLISNNIKNENNKYLENIGLNNEYAIRDTSKDNRIFIDRVINNWVQNFMKDNDYTIVDNEGGGDCFFAVVRDAYKNIEQLTIEDIRKLLIDSVNVDTYDQYKTLYLNFNSSYKSKENEMKLLKKSIYELKRRKDNITNINDNRDILNEANILVDKYKKLGLEKSYIKELLDEFIFMKNINNIEEFKTFILTNEYWADTWSMSIIEEKMNIKIIILSEESYKNKDYDSVLLCGQLNNDKVQQPNYYIITTYNGNHYQLVKYNDQPIFKFDEIPEDIKKLIINKCLESNAGPYYSIDDFRKYKKELGISVVDDNNENDVFNNDLYNKDVVFMFHEHSNPKNRPGKGSGETILDDLIVEFIELYKSKHKNWRRKLDDNWKSPFILDNKRWLTVTHYVLGSQFKKGYPDFYYEFSLDSDSKIANDIELAKIAGSKTGKTKKVILRKPEIEIDNDFYTYDNKGRYIEERISALESKFTQNADLRELLIATKQAKLNKFIRNKNAEPDIELMKLRKVL